MLSRQCGRFSRHRSMAGRLCVDTPLDLTDEIGKMIIIVLNKTPNVPMGT
jgi:hypothetical protein